MFLLMSFRFGIADADEGCTGPVVLSFVGSTGSTTISFILPGLFYWQVSNRRCLWFSPGAHAYVHPFQLTRNDPGSSKLLNRAALALAIYGGLVFTFWYALPLYSIVYLLNFSLHSLSFNIYQVITQGTASGH
jgi:hypothetical protein